MGWRAFFGVADRIAGTKSVEFKLTVSPCIANQTVPPVIANGCPATEYNSFGKVGSGHMQCHYRKQPVQYEKLAYNRKCLDQFVELPQRLRQ